MKPSSEYLRPYTLTAQDFARFIEMHGLRVAPCQMAKPPHAHRTAIAQHIGRQSKVLPPENQFEYYATLAAESLISEFMKFCDNRITPAYCEGDIELLDEREAAYKKTRRDLLLQVREGYFIGKPCTLGSIQARLYGEFVLYRQWLNDQLTALRKPQPTQEPATPQPTPQPPAPAKVPHFTTEATQAILGALQPFLSEDHAQLLPELLNGAQPKKRLFLGQYTAKALTIAMRDAYERNHIGGVSKAQLVEWIYNAFEFQQRSTLKTLTEYMKPSARASKQHRIKLSLKKNDT